MRIYVFLFPKTQSVNLDALAGDSINDDDLDPELLTDERASCGLYTIWCVRMLLRYIFKTIAAYKTYMLVETSIEWMEWDFQCIIIHNLQTHYSIF